MIRPSRAKGAENDAKWTPGGAFGSTLELGKRHTHNKKVFFCTCISGVYFTRHPGPDFLRNPVGMTWPKSCLDRAGASGSHIDHFRKKSSPGQVFVRFRVRFGCPAEPLGRLFAEKVVKCGRWLRSRFRSYGNRRNSPRLKSSQMSKAI